MKQKETHPGCINTRVDTPSKRGEKFTSKQMAVYFAYLVRSKRNPNGLEPYRYLYKKDIIKKELGEQLGISQPTIRSAEQKLVEKGYMQYSGDGKIIYFPDTTLFSWIPIKTIMALLELSKAVDGGGDLLRLYAVLYHFRESEQEFCARTWVYAFGLNESKLENYIHIHILLFLLKFYGFINYEEVEERASGGKLYKKYTNVKVIEDEKVENYDDRMGQPGEVAEEYRRVLEALQLKEE